MGDSDLEPTGLAEIIGVVESLPGTFLPPYQHGWIGRYLDLGSVDWDEVRDLLTHACLLTAPKTPARQVEAGFS